MFIADRNFSKHSEFSPVGWKALFFPLFVPFVLLMFEIVKKIHDVFGFFVSFVPL